MIRLEQIRELAISSPSKIVMLIIDGIGGLPDPRTGKTELETAKTPNLDRLAKEGICGLIDPVSSGITPGSAPGHLALFGYDPFQFDIGRGVLEALGIGFDLEEKDVAARGNFCTVDSSGLISDRRAGRISTEECTELCELLRLVKLEDVDLFVLPVREHRFVAVFRGEELYPEVTDSDPQRIWRRLPTALSIDQGRLFLSATQPTWFCCVVSPTFPRFLSSVRRISWTQWQSLPILCIRDLPSWSG